MGARSRKQRRSQPASGGSSLCCAGQRRRHAEHHGRLLLRGRGPRGCAAGLLHLGASGRAVGPLPDEHGTTSAISAALLAYYTSAQVDALLADYRTASAQDTQTQAAITGALLAYRTGPDQDVFTPNQITSALVAYRSAADQDTATASSIAAALLSYYTAGKLGVTEAASALQIAVRFLDDGGADKVVAAIGKQILGPMDVSLANSSQQRLQRGPGHAHRGRSECGRLHPDPGSEPLEHRAHLQLDAWPRAPLRLPAPAWHGLQLRGAHVRGRQRLRPPVRQQGAWSTAKMYFTVPPNGVAELHFGAAGKLREDCVEGALERGLAGGERGVRGVRGQQRRVGLGALERRDAGVTAGKLRWPGLLPWLEERLSAPSKPALR